MVGDPQCPACMSPDGQTWPQRHFDGIAVNDCTGLVHCEEVPLPDSPGVASVMYRCDVCGDSL
jgi:hypothetical protein